MRQLFPLAVLLIGGSLFTACSKKADTAPGSATAPDQASSAAAPEEETDSAISFSLSGGNRTDTGATTGSSPGQAASQNPDQTEPVQLNEIYPFYPLSLRMRAIEGRVVVRVEINTQGRVANAEVMRATEERFVPYALAAVRAARFIPATKMGKPVPSEGVMTVPFISELGSGSLSPDSVFARLAYLDGMYYMKDASGKMVPADTKEPLRLRVITPIPATAKPGDTLRARVRVAITDEGQVTNVSVTEASNPEFAAELKELALFWQFIPQMKAGKPVAAPAIEFPITATVPASDAR